MRLGFIINSAGSPSYDYWRQAEGFELIEQLKDRVKVSGIAERAFNKNFAADVTAIASNSDVVITWGVPDLAELLPKHCKTSIVVASFSPYRREYLDTCTLLTRHYVGTGMEARYQYSPELRHKVTELDKPDDWASYLAAIHSHRKVRVAVVLGNLLIGGVSTWLLSLIQYCHDLDWCCLCVVGKHEKTHPPLRNEVQRLGCPYSYCGNDSGELAQAFTYCRPDVVLVWGVADLKILPAGLPVVLVSHDEPSGIKKQFALNVCSGVKRASHFAAVSNLAVTSFPPKIRKRVTVIPNGIEPPAQIERSEARAALNLNGVVVGMVGRVSAEKHPEALAAAIELLPSEYTALYCGPIHEPQIWQELIKHTRRITYLAGMLPSAARKIYPALDCFVCASEADAFNLSIVEAWAAGIPVVSTRVGVVRDRPCLVVPIKHNAPAAAVAAAIVEATSPANAERVKRARKIALDCYSVNRMAADWQQLLTRAALG